MSWTLEDLLATWLLPAALLSTNLTFGSSLPETAPIIFVVVGLIVMLARKRIERPGFCFLYLAVVLYGIAGLFGDRPMDGVRIGSAALVAIAAAQFVRGRSLARACAISLIVLFVLRILSVLLPGPFSALYALAGLRSADLYGGGPAILFAEPSYLATAVLTMWAIVRMAEPAELAMPVVWLDVSAITVLLLSFSASAALYSAIGIFVLLRRRPLVIAALIALIIAASSALVVFSGTRLDVLFRAATAVLQQSGTRGAIDAFSAVDPSSAFRLSMTVLAIKAAVISPFGHLRIEMSNALSAATGQDYLGILSSNELVSRFYGNLQPNTVPLQMLFYGGWPLLALILVPVIGAMVCVVRSGQSSGSYLLIAAITSECLLESVLTSPFFYIAVICGLHQYRAIRLSTTIPYDPLHRYY